MNAFKKLGLAALAAVALLATDSAAQAAPALHPVTDYRLLSGEAATDSYYPGSLNVKIPKAFFPPDQIIEIKVPIVEKPILPVPAPNSQPTAAAVPAVDAATGEMIRPATPGVSPAPKPAEPPKPKFKIVKKTVPAPSPFRRLLTTDFNYYQSEDATYPYGLPLPKEFKADPLAKLPLEGPMLIRAAGDSLFMAVSVDDPQDTYHFRNTNSMVSFPGAKEVFSEYRATAENKTLACTYRKTLVAGVKCFVLQGTLAEHGKTYQLLYVFPEGKSNAFIPYSLYSMENFSTKK